MAPEQEAGRYYSFDWNNAHFVSLDSNAPLVRSVNGTTFQIQVQKAGFKSAVRSGIRLQVEQVARLDFTLDLGSVAESIEVTATAPLIESETASVGQVINNKSIVEMPLNGRNAWRLVQLSAATFFVGGIGDAQEIPVASMAGGRAFSQGLYVDGGSVQKSGMARAMAEMGPVVDSVEEFKVITNNYAAEYGRSAGGVFSAVIKSGTNQFRSSVPFPEKRCARRAQYVFFD
jgi:hypothetical protein